MFGLILAVSNLGMAGVCRAVSVQVALTPQTINVASGDMFDVHVQVTQPGPAFNAYSATIGFDPALLTFVQQPASVQEGAYMKNACGSTFNSFTPAPGALHIEHAIVCPNLSLTGPGELYVLRFQAGTITGSTELFFTQVQFSNAGVLVPTTSGNNVVIQIGTPTDAGSTTASASAMDLRVAPNPFSAGTGLKIDTNGHGAATLTIYDPRGRAVLQRHLDAFGPGSRRFVWTGADLLAGHLSAGTYFVTVRNPEHTSVRRVTLVK